MSIQWYPGHMTKARRLLAESIPSNDVVVEVVDARMPAASANPVLTELRRDKPCIKVLAKSDLADPLVTAAWLRHFAAHARAGDVAIAVTTQKAAETNSQVIAMCKRVGARSAKANPVRAIVVGVPNAGKSTLINTLAGRRVAKVGDEPAVTKTEQRVVLDGVVLSDNPGILWPKFEDEAVAYRLALGGAVPDTVIDYESVARFGAEIFLARYAALVVARYGLEETPAGADRLLTAVGKRRGCVRRGGEIDLHKAADILVHEFRTGALWRITVEEPPS